MWEIKIHYTYILLAISNKNLFLEVFDIWFYRSQNVIDMLSKSLTTLSLIISTLTLSRVKIKKISEILTKLIIWLIVQYWNQLKFNFRLF